MHKRSVPYFRIVAALLLLALMALTAGCTGSGASSGPRTQTVPMQVDNVKVAVGTEKPVRVQVQISGVVGDSCNKLDKVVQSRSDNAIAINITVVRTLDVPCMQLAQLYNETVNLEGDFPPGQYTVTVNSVATSFTVR